MCVTEPAWMTPVTRAAAGLRATAELWRLSRTPRRAAPLHAFSLPLNNTYVLHDKEVCGRGIPLLLYIGPNSQYNNLFESGANVCV